jgi:hypothetical protein
MVSMATDARPMPDGFVRLAASIPLHNDGERVAAVLDGGALWADRVVTPASLTGLRRYAVDLRLRVGRDGPALTTFSKAAYVDLGTTHRTPAGWEAEIGWQASTAAPLFPVFSGWLIISDENLRVDGVYAPPGGVVGRVADRVLLHIAANGTARWLLNEIDRAALGAAA